MRRSTKKRPGRWAVLVVLAIIGAMAPVVVAPARPTLAGQTTFAVTKTTDTNDGACTVSDCSLREAVIAANAMGDTAIDLPAGTYRLTIGGRQENLGATGDLDLRKSVTIRGAGARKTIIDGGSIDRVVHTPIQGVASTPFTVSIFGVTITGGATEPPDDIGGGILHQARGATLHLIDSTVRGNTALQGGGIQNGGGQGFGETMIIRRSTISGNRARDGQGGGLQNTENLTLENTTVSNNPSQFGGGIMQFSGTLRITDSTIAFNRAQQPGGGIFLSSGAPTLKNTIVSDNTSDFQDNCSRPLTSEGNNLERGTTCGFNQRGDKNADPRLGPLANNGGPTDTHAPRKGSPAINAGGAPFPPTDQRGVARPRGAVNDIGTVEPKRRRR